MDGERKPSEHWTSDRIAGRCCTCGMPIDVAHCITQGGAHMSHARIYCQSCCKYCNPEHLAGDVRPTDGEQRGLGFENAEIGKTPKMTRTKDWSKKDGGYPD